MEKKIGVYICKGCGIGDALDIDKLSQIATEEFKLPCKVHESLCGEAGVNLIKGDIEGEGVNTVVIAACSHRVNWDVFNFGPEVIVERANIREQVAWSQPPKNDFTQEMAEDYLRMAITKAQKVEIPPGYKDEEAYNKTILVVGGGITGLTAALGAANANYDVVLIEKEAQLGGWVAKWWKTYPYQPPYKELQDSGIEEKIKAVMNHPKIKVYTSTKIEKTEGQPGHFDITLNQSGKTEQIRVGSIILAIGWKPYDARKLDHLGYGKYANVITQIEMEDMAQKGQIISPATGKPAQNVVFIQCAGQRDPNHLPYCSSWCCLVSLKQAKYVREMNPEAKVYIFYRDMRTPGQYEEFYKNAQNDVGIFLTKGEVVGVTENPDKTLNIEVENTLLGEDITVKADLVVLATGMVSRMEGIPTTREDVIKAYGLTGQEEPDVIEKTIAETPQPWEGVLNLAYRQGPEVPILKYNLPDSNFICFPYESRRTGIYPAGCVRQPQDIEACIRDAEGAALKAIQCMEMETRGETVHPRSGDLSYPEFFFQRCTQCKRCTQECPFGALDEDEKGTPKPNYFRCRRCGTCMGACPERIIGFQNYNVDIISSMIKAISVPEDDEEKLRILCLACENDAYPALDMAGLNHLQYSPLIRVIPVRCLGSVNLVFITDALSRGIDGVLLLGCKYGDDYQCHFVRGSELANYRMGKLQETLNNLGLEAERAQLVEVAITDYDKLPGIIDKFIEKIKELGPNPFKGW
ncbi:MAG: FAD-dependent oxidoreductase [Candidatus Desulfofervidaceae bacterium]|nr:FAD-dependent oxidoreductase [Candidatus Desulfofervidaceae bacterium]